MSFGFEVDLDSWQRDADGVMVRTLHQVTLHEVSPVTFPAYPQLRFLCAATRLGISRQFRRILRKRRTETTLSGRRGASR